MPSIKQQIKRSIEKTNKIKSTEFKSTNNLSFGVAPFYDPSITKFEVGTCKGIYTCESTRYVIIAVTNDERGNGHLQDVFDWFENSCKRDKKDLMVAELMNERFKKHLIEKRGFVAIEGNNVIKHLKNIK